MLYQPGRNTYFQRLNENDRIFFETRYSFWRAACEGLKVVLDETPYKPSNGYEGMKETTGFLWVADLIEKTLAINTEIIQLKTWQGEKTC